MTETLLPKGKVAKLFGVSTSAIHNWVRRYSDFPANQGIPEYPLYRKSEVLRWFAQQWPDRVDQYATRLHYFTVEPGHVELETTVLGPLREAKGYLQAMRNYLFDGWRVYSTPMGFSAHRGNDVRVLVLDLSDDEPEPWFTYDARFRAGR